MGSLSGSPPPAADPAIGEAARMQAQTGQEWLAFSRDQFAVTNDRLRELDELTRSVSAEQMDLFRQYASEQSSLSERSIQLATDNAAYTRNVTERQLARAEEQDAFSRGIADEFAGYARADRQRYERVYRPIEDRYIADVRNFDTPERQAAAAAEAKADVKTAAQGAREQANREAMGLGINPASGRFAGIQRSADTATALAEAGAANTARQGVRDRGMALRRDLVGMGSALPAQAGANAQTAVGVSGSGSGQLIGTMNAGLGANQAGTGMLLGSLGNAGATGQGIAGLGINTAGLTLGDLRANNALNIEAANIPGQGYRGQMAGYSGQANVLQGQHNTAVNVWGKQQDLEAQNIAGILGAIGGIAGIGLGFVSDPKAKKNRRKVRDGEGIQALRDMPAEEFDYKEGQGDGGHHVGPMADDFARATGKGDGKTISVQDAIGVTVAAVQDLDRKVEKIADAVGVGVRRNTDRVAGLRRAA